jgi:uncharacterized protein (DUF2336 family)
LDPSAFPDDGMTKTLSLNDVERLLADGTAHSRAVTAAKMASIVDTATLSAARRVELERVLRVFAGDAELIVRAALADHVKSSELVPLDIVASLARDAAAVAEPILSTSTLLTDELLVEIIADGDAAKQLAIAGRAGVSGTVSEALIENGDERAVTRLAANERAEIPESGFGRMLDRFANSASVAGSIANRVHLPPTIAARVIARVSELLSADLVARHALPERVAARLAEQAREQATVGYAALVGEAEASQSLARQMNDAGKLSPSVIVRAVCMGDLPFFEMALALRAGVPLASAQALIHDTGGRGLSALFERAKLPPSFLPVIRAATAAIGETAYDGLPGDRMRYMHRIIERVLTQVEEVGVETLDYLMERLAEPVAA